VKIHSLPLKLWLNKAITFIGNKLGKMLDIDEKVDSMDRTSIAKIFMEMNLGDGFLEGIDIQV
jgi:hypothetical protein